MDRNVKWLRLAAPALALLCLPAVTAPAGAAPAWAATATGAATVAGMVAAGPLDPATVVPVTVTLALRHAGVARRDAAAGSRLTPAEFSAEFAPTPTQVATVVAALRHRGLTGVTPAADDLSVSATGSAAAVSGAFDTSLERVLVRGRSYFTNTKPALAPSSAGGTISAVLGLDDLPRLAVPPAVDAASTQCGTASTTGRPICFYHPDGLVQAYDSTALAPATATSIAVFTDGNLSQVVSDFAAERSSEGLPSITPQVVPTGPAGTDTSGTVEWDLDSQVSAGVAGNVAGLYLYDASAFTDQALYQSYVAFTTPAAGSSAPAAQIGSLSYGECEAGAAQSGAMAADDAEFMKAYLQGQTIFAASGDQGGDCPGPTVNGTQTYVAGVSYPASSPYVVAVGGTALTTDSTGSYAGEQGWDSSGGGISTYEQAPPWQSSDGFPAAQVTAACSGVASGAPCGRTVPDIASDADPDVSPAVIVVNGSAAAVGGTSLSAPLVLGQWARLETSAGNGLGYAAPLLYGLAGTAAIHDITSTAPLDPPNGGSTPIATPYPTTTGYDLVTGIGSLDVAQAERTLDSGPPHPLPESPWAVGLPIAGALAGAGALWRRRRRA